MKSFMPLALAFAIGCSSASRASEPAPEPAPGEAKAASARAELAMKTAELRKVDEELAQIATERGELNAKPASEEKTNRMAELARLEGEARQRRLSLETEIARLEKPEAPAPEKPATADEAIEKALADAKKAEEAAAREKAEAEKRKAEELAMKEKAEAEKRRAEEAARAKPPEPAPKPPDKPEPKPAEPVAKPPDKPEMPLAPAEGEAVVFEEKWAEVILKVRAELQRFKRW